MFTSLFPFLPTTQCLPWILFLHCPFLLCLTPLSYVCSLPSLLTQVKWQCWSTWVMCMGGMVTIRLTQSCTFPNKQITFCLVSWLTGDFSDWSGQSRPPVCLYDRENHSPRAEKHVLHLGPHRLREIFELHPAHSGTAYCAGLITNFILPFYHLWFYMGVRITDISRFPHYETNCIIRHISTF